jgi:hypothetical protein
MTGPAQKALDEFTTKLAAQGEARFTLDRNSSDLLLVLLLPQLARHIITSSGDAMTDGVSRLRWFAARFREMSKVEAEVSPDAPLA